MHADTIRAWKDPLYRTTLSPAELASLPANPAGQTWAALPEEELLALVGGGSGQLEAAGSGGYVCTLTTECPIWSFCCRAN
jgi:mersacidin/lichenicidin family type 2 lantibiotic